MKKRFSILLIGVVCISQILTAEQPNHLLASGRVLIAAHRGGYENEVAEKCPENSLVNIDNAISKKFEVFETDLRVTKDGVFVIVHDGEISLETNGSGAVEDQDWQDLKQLKKRYRNRGGKKAVKGTVSSESIATFEQFLQRAKQRIILKVDLKPGAHLHFKEIMAQVVEYDMLEWTIFRINFKDFGYFEQYLKEGNPYSNNTLMFKATSKKQIDRVKEVFDSATIEVTFKGRDVEAEHLDLVGYAVAKGFLVEQHSSKDDAKWSDQIEAGVRMFHTACPLKMKQYLEGRE